jgi:hypothetical protein
MLPGPMLLYIAYDIHRKVREDERKLEAKKAAEMARQNAEPTSAPGSAESPHAGGLQPAAA